MVDTAQKKVWAIGVAYAPDMARLDAVIASLQTQVQQVLIVDNTPEPPAELHEYWQSWTKRGVVVLELGRNLGIAAAQNLGARHAMGHGATALLFFDHDSVFASDYVAQIEEAYGRLVGNIGALGGLAFDQRETDASKRDILAYRFTRFGPRRYPDATLRTASANLSDGGILPAAFLIASGLYVPVETWQAVGPMNADMFIDHVDLEWSARANAAGRGTVLVTGATIDHQLGDDVVKIPGRAQVVHVHSPFRVFYLVRNTCWLIRGIAPIPATWRLGYAVWLAKFVAFNLVFAPRLTRDRAQRAMTILRALRAGWGRMPAPITAAPPASGESPASESGPVR